MEQEDADAEIVDVDTPEADEGTCKNGEEEKEEEEVGVDFKKSDPVF